MLHQRVADNAFGTDVLVGRGQALAAGLRVGLQRAKVPLLLETPMLHQRAMMQ